MARPMLFRTAAFAMGTRFEFVLAGEDERHLRAVGDSLRVEVSRLDALLSVFRPDSSVARVNAGGDSGPVRVDAETFDLLRRCAGYAHGTGGSFDITIGALMQRWGFRADGGPPAAGAPFGISGLVLDSSTSSARFARPGLRLDLGAVAKGYALDACAELCREAGVTNAFLHGGTSSALAIGSPAGAPGWRVRLGPAPDAPVATLTDCAMSISAPRGRTVEAGGEILGHVMDPGSGRPVGGIESATVLCPGACDADAWSTAALVRGAGAAEGMLTVIERAGAGAGRWEYFGSARGCRVDAWVGATCCGA